MISERVGSALRRIAVSVSAPRLARRADIARLGSAYGGWWVPKAILKRCGVALSAGAGEDISFDIDLARYKYRVLIVDPTPRATAHVEEVLKAIQNGDTHFASKRVSYDLDGILPEQITFWPVGLWSTDAELRFYRPRNTSHVSHSATNLQRTTEFFVAQCKCLKTIMDELRLDRVDIIKMDIEGAEAGIIDDMLSNGIFPEVVLVEFDCLRGHRPYQAYRVLRHYLRCLRHAGYSIIWREGYNFTFWRLPPSATSILT